jgi:hypothetical protein
MKNSKCHVYGLVTLLFLTVHGYPLPLSRKYLQPLQKFAKESRAFATKCTKPTERGAEYSWHDTTPHPSPGHHTASRSYPRTHTHTDTRTLRVTTRTHACVRVHPHARNHS